MPTKYLVKLNEFHIKKIFKNSNTREILIKAYKDAQDEIISKIEEPNLILENYLMNINKKIKFSINGQIGLSFIDI